jgi:hypothetical protein
MMQNFGSKPQINCNIVIDEVIIIGFLYFMINSFILILAAVSVRSTTRLAIFIRQSHFLFF